MKKILVAFGAAALLTAGFSSCNKGASNASPEDVAFGDSVAVALGQFAGAQSNSQYVRMKEMQPEMAAKFNKESYLKGIKAVLDADTADMAYYQGLQMGLQLVNPIIGINNDAKVPVSKAKVLEAFKKVYEADSVADMQTYYAEYQKFMEQLQTRMQAKEMEAKQNSPEAKKNAEEGKAYAEKMVKEGYTKAPSGLVYKIENPGAAPKVTNTDQVKVKYTGKDIAGNVFDTNEGNVQAMRAGGFVPGFSEALCMLGKGGKMTVVIPAELAYGVNGAGDKIGPNQTLVFDIEIEDITPAAE